MSAKISKKITCRDIDGKTYEVDSSDLIFRPSIYGILVRDNKILLFPQWDGYDFPGGGLDLHETVEEGLIREFWEETGLTVKPKQLIACTSSFFYSQTMKRAFNAILLHYTVEWVSGELSADNFDEHEKSFSKLAEWIDLDRISTTKFISAGDGPAIIRKALKTL